MSAKKISRVPKKQGWKKNSREKSRPEANRVKMSKDARRGAEKKPVEIKEKMVLDEVKVEERFPAIEGPPEPKKELPVMEEEVTEKHVVEEKHDYKNEAEALLFAYGKYVEEDIISDMCHMDKRSLKKVLDELKHDYEQRNSALMLFQQEKSWKINVRERYLPIVRKIVADTELSRSVMETLAVIAWKSPVFQSEIVRIRGNKCYDHIDELETSGFVSKEKRGRSYVLKTSDKFFNYFEIDHGNLKSLMDTVKMPEINAEEISKQMTLDNPELIGANEADKVHAIDVRKKTETEEEKQAHHTFLTEIEKRIAEAAEKNRLLAEDIPRPALHEPGDIQPPLASDEPDVTHITIANAVVEGKPGEKQEEAKPAEQPKDATSKETATAPAGEPTAQKSEKPKHKSLTKRQLERKFKDELLRVRDKMEKK